LGRFPKALREERFLPPKEAVGRPTSDDLPSGKGWGGGFIDDEWGAYREKALTVDPPRDVITGAGDS